jgi:hypothetical protein
MSARNPSLEGHEGFQASPWKAEIRLLFAVAACVFTVTVLIGLLNGQKVVTLSQNVLLTHVHAGTLGWITLGVFALSLWLFGAGQPSARESQLIHWTSILAAVAIPVYVAAFFSGNFLARAIFGFPVLIAIVAFLGWVVWKATRASLGIPQWAVLGALVTLTIGGLLGVSLQIGFAAGKQFLPGGAFAAHPSALVSGYLILVGMAVSEWRLRSTRNDDFRLGIAQISCFFASGLLVAVAFLADVVPLLGLNTLLLLAGTVIYVLRFAGRASGAAWTTRSSERFFLASGIFIVVYVALTLVLTIGLVSGAFTPDTIPTGVLLAGDHTMFIGVMTNALLGLIQDGTREQQVFWPWENDVIFWGVNVGLIGFIIGLITGATIFERLFTPIMGLGLLLAIVVYATLLIRRPAAVRVAPTR